VLESMRTLFERTAFPQNFSKLSTRPEEPLPKKKIKVIKKIKKKNEETTYPKVIAIFFGLGTSLMVTLETM